MVEGTEGKSEIAAIPSKYKDTLDDLIDSSDEKSPDQLGPIHKGSRNALRSKGSSIGLLEGDCCLDSEDVSDTSLGLAPKT